MAERVGPTPPRPPPPGPHPTTTTTSPPTDGRPSLPPAAPANTNPLTRPTETYVVQVPKEQIYRVPPPENAKLVEQYRNNHNNRRQRRPIVSCLKWTIGIALVLAILAAIIAIIYLLVVRPADPSFSVTRVVLRNPNRRAGSLPKPEYDFTMRVENPSLRMGYSYGAGGKAILAHDGADIAAGKTRKFEQGYQNTTTFGLVLQGSHKVLPKQIQRSLKGSKDVIPMSLVIEFSVEKTIGEMVMGSKSMDVTCDIKVSGLAEARVVSQECETKFTYLSLAEKQISIINCYQTLFGETNTFPSENDSYDNWRLRCNSQILDQLERSGSEVLSFSLFSIDSDSTIADGAKYLSLAEKQISIINCYQTLFGETNTFPSENDSYDNWRLRCNSQILDQLERSGSEVLSFSLFSIDSDSTIADGAKCSKVNASLSMSF
ncbi:putative NDR1/HIN1-like protein 13 [Cocos nucifera]|uniref:Putative NDR1/HIN1-like protein 13 n=1 Tax=Cocos nucifera TaxID=13894 RepID=A0A8K0I2I2_COCNU|nr:putative NDR1/HIN1-like protein 13 [Cocos nucifera]